MVYRRPASASLILSLLILAGPAPAPPGRALESASGPGPAGQPNVIFICVDTLRADHLTAYGCGADLSPNLDKLLSRGVLMSTARTPIPLTGPAVSSVLSSLHPHQHGATRNGVPLFEGQILLTDLLAEKGYQTAAVMSNWTLRARLSGLGDHFHSFHEVFNQKRWRGVFKSEGSAAAVNSAASRWLDLERETGKPFFLWVHYIEPHAPYRYHSRFSAAAGLRGDAPADAPQRYATEVAFADHYVGLFLEELKQRDLYQDSLIVFFADHGESLGEHSTWGHGRHCYEQGLRIPLGFSWPGVIAPGLTVEAQTTLLDVAPTLLGLLGIAPPPFMLGRDLSPVCRGEAKLGEERCYYQAQRGAVLFRKNVRKGRSNGLLEVCMITGERKEILRFHSPPRLVSYELGRDPDEKLNTARFDATVPAALTEWLAEVERALEHPAAVPTLSEEDVEELRALGYLE